MILAEIIETTTAIGRISGNIDEYGFMSVAMAVFLLVTIGLFLGTNKRYNKLFEQVLHANEQKTEDMNKSISNLIERMTEVLTIVKENQEGITEKAKHAQTYTGSIKIIKNYLNATKLEIIKYTNKIIEKNNTEDTAMVRRKINSMIRGIQKKRAIDLREFTYSNICFSDIMPNIDLNDCDMITAYIQSKDRNLDKFIGELDAIYNDVLNEVEARFLASGGN